MSPAVKYTLGRVGLFVVILAGLLPFKLNLFLDMMIALAISMPLSFFLLRRWRDQMADRLDSSMQQRRDEKVRLRAALSGDDTDEPDASDTADRTDPANPRRKKTSRR